MLKNDHPIFIGWAANARNINNLNASIYIKYNELVLVVSSSFDASIFSCNFAFLGKIIFADRLYNSFVSFVHSVNWHKSMVCYTKCGT